MVISTAPANPAIIAHPRRFVSPRPSPLAAPLARPRPEPWTAQLLHRVRLHLWLKLAGITAFMWVFFLGYFHLLRNPVRPVMEMPLTALDLAIQPQPAALVAYVSLWFYVGVAPGLMPSLRDLVIYGLWAAALCLTGLASFYLWPTAVPPPQLSADLSQHPGFVLLQGVDAAGNACPSLHVATALFSAMWIQRQMRQVGAPRAMNLLNWAWLALIVYSTLAIKQHVVIDALAGAALGGLFGWASLRWFAGRGR